MSEIARWLARIGLDQYAPAFADSDVDIEVLPELTDADLKELGVSLGHRKKLLKAIATVRSEQAATLPLTVDPIVEGAAHGGAEGERAAWSRTPGERKPVTMLFADVVGSTALTERLDAEEAHELLYGATRRMCDAVEINHGTVCRFMGDGVMAMFGAPVASEQHAVEACRAALDMLRGVEEYAEELVVSYGTRIEIRVGLHSGEVVVLAVGDDPEKPEYDASGPTVPLAARMEQTAPAGTVLMTESTRALASELIDVEARPPVSVKGFSAPIGVFRLRAMGTGSGSDHRVTGFVGRLAEQAQFKGLLEACSQSGRGHSVLVRGEAGIGKTRLLREFERLAVALGFVSHRCLTLDFGTGRGQDPTRTLMRSLLGIAPGTGKAGRQEALERAISNGLASGEHRVFLNDLLDLAQPIELRAMYEAMENSTRNRGKRGAVADLVTRLSARTPLLILVEDIHWADPVTLAHMSTLAKTVADSASVLVLSTRIEGDPIDRDWRSAAAGAALVTVDLGPLHGSEAHELAAQLGDMTSESVRECVRRAAGHPLFLEQLLRGLDAVAGNVLPDTIQSLVLARIDRLSPVDKRGLQAASVIGQRFELEQLRAVLDDAEYSCEPLAEHFLVRPDGTRYLFAHALIREAVYASLLKVTRKHLHQRCAEWFADEDATLHAQHLDRAGSSNAPIAYLQAAREQDAAYRAERARQLIERGLQISRTQGERFALSRAKGELLGALGAIDDAIASFEAARSYAETEVDQCRAQIGLAAQMRITEQPAQGFALLEQAESVARHQGLDQELSQIYYLRGSMCFTQGQQAQALEAAEQAWKYARRAGSPDDEARALSNLGDAAYLRGAMLSAHRSFQACIELCREHGLGRVEVANRCMISATRVYQLELRESVEDGLAAMKMAQVVGNLRAGLYSRTSLFFPLMDLEDWEALAEHLTPSEQLVRRLGATSAETEVQDARAALLLATGRRQDAIALLEQAVAGARQNSARYYAPIVLAHLASATDDENVKRVALREAEGLLQDGCVSHCYLVYYRRAIDIALRDADWQGARRYADAMAAYTQAEPLPWSDFFIDRARALAAFGCGEFERSSTSELQRLRAVALRVGLRSALPALEAALAAE